MSSKMWKSTYRADFYDQHGSLGPNAEFVWVKSIRKYTTAVARFEQVTSYQQQFQPLPYSRRRLMIPRNTLKIVGLGPPNQFKRRKPYFSMEYITVK